MRSILFLVFIFSVAVSSRELKLELSPTVEVAQGSVQGSVKATSEGRQFYAYQGIPYAKAPTGPLRFKAPVAPDPWTGVLQVTDDPPHCIQITWTLENRTEGIEDCLHLNVYTPILPDETSNPSLPVHVYVHGGSFTNGEIDYGDENPERYMNYDVVVVNMKYRLGPLGFLSTDDEAASGNWGLLDQNFALQWVQQNIAAFGGNPKDVTLSGQSAGSASVIFQYQSPMSAGLFHRVIAESGSSLCPWAVEESPLYYAKRMGENFNCSTDNTTDLIECLRELPAEDIVGHSLDMMFYNLTLCFVPNVETSPAAQFLPKDPLTAFQTGDFNQVPLQLGFNRDEGDFAFQYVYFLFYNISDVTFDVVVPLLLHAFTDYRTNLINVSYAIKDEYYADVDLDNQTAVNIASIGFIGDMFMKSWISQTAILVSSLDVPVYLYAYNYVSNHSSANFTGEQDVTHGNELQYLWYRNIANSKDFEFQTRFFPLWLDFITEGNHGIPSPSDDVWKATAPGEYNYFEIQDSFTMQGNYDPEKMHFWWDTVPSIVYA